MPKPKKSKAVSLVAYESGAETASDNDEENSNDSQQSSQASSDSKSDTDQQQEAVENEQKDDMVMEENGIVNENDEIVESIEVTNKIVQIDAQNAQVEVNKDQSENSSTSIYTLENGFPPGCEFITLPPAPTSLCSPILQNKIVQVLERMKPPFNYSINDDIQKKKMFKNPSIYESLLESNKTEQYGSSFPNHIPDLKASGYMNYLELDELQRAEWAKKEKEKKERTKIEMVSAVRKK